MMVATSKWVEKQEAKHALTRQGLKVEASRFECQGRELIGSKTHPRFPFLRLYGPLSSIGPADCKGC